MRFGRKQLVVLACVIVALLMVCLELWMRNGSRPRVPSALVCAEPRVDLGETGRREHTHTFALTNTTSDPVSLTSIGKSCACLRVVTSDSIIRPGSTVKLTATIEVRTQTPGMITRFNETILVHPAGYPPIELRIGGLYVPPAYHQDQQIVISVPGDTDAPFESEVELFLNRQKHVELVGVRKSGALRFDAFVKGRFPLPTEPFEKVVIRVCGTFEKRGIEPQQGEIICQTTSQDLPEIRIPVIVRPLNVDAVRFEPERLAFGVLQGNRRASRTLLFRWPTEAAYEVVDVKPSGRGITASVGRAKVEGPSTALAIECTLDAASEQLTGLISEHVAVTLSRRQERQTYNVPVSAFVKSDPRSDK